MPPSTSRPYNYHHHHNDDPNPSAVPLSSPVNNNNMNMNNNISNHQNNSDRSPPFKSTFHNNNNHTHSNINTAMSPAVVVTTAPNSPLPSNTTAAMTNNVNSNGTAVVGADTDAADDILLEGTALKRKTYLSKNFWDERHFIFRSNHVLEYYRKKTDTIEECRGKFPISHRTGCDISDLYVRKHKNELIYCMTISFTQLDYDTAIIGSGGNDPLNNSISNVPDMNMEDENSSIGNVSRNDIAESTQSIGEHFQPHSDMALNGSMHSPRQKRSSSPTKKPIVGITKLLASPFLQNRRSISSESSKTPISLRSVDAESVTYGSQQQKRMSGLLRQRRPNALSRRALSHTGLLNANHQDDHRNNNNNHHRRNPMYSTSAMSVEGQFVPDTVEVPVAHRTSIPPPIISTTIKPRSNSTTSVDGNTGTTNYNNNLNPNNGIHAVLENGTIVSSVTPVISNNRRSSHNMNNNNNDDEEVDEQELLRSEYITTKENDKHKAKDLVVQSTKLAAAVGATVSLTVLTAGVGLVAGLIVLGVAGAAGGGGAAVNATWLRNSKGNRTKYEMSIAFYDYDIAKQWKSILDAALESDIVHKSTWGQLFASDGRMARAALLPKLRQISGDCKLVTDRTANDDGTVGKISPLRRNAKWTLIEGGLLAIVGCGFQGLRIYREEHDNACRRLQRRRLCPTITGNPLPPPPPPPQVYASVDGKPCPPMKAHVVLSTSPLDAFLCLMSHGRVDSTKIETEYDMDDEDDMFDSDHRISFEIIESIDENTDVIRMIYRPMFLFPAWTNPRDFVLFRYWRLDPDGSYVVCYESMVHPKCPPIPHYVRGEMHSVFHIAPQKKSQRKSKIKPSQPMECLMTATVQVDPKGWVPTAQWSCLSNQAYGDAFGIYALLKLIDIRDAIDEDRFVAATSDHPVKLSPQLITTNHKFQMAADGTRMTLPLSPTTNFELDHGLTRNASTDTNDETLHEDYMDYDFTYAGNESMDFPSVNDGMTRICSRPPPLTRRMWAEPDSNSFRVRGVHYKHDRLKYNAGPSIGRLMCVDVVSVDKPLYGGFSLHPTERIQLALQKERELLAKGLESDLPPFIFIVNICLPGPPYYHGVYYYAVQDIRTINGEDGTPSSKLCREFFFGESDEFRDRTFKLIPQIVQGNFIVRKAVGSTPAIMGKKLRQLYVKNERYFEVILDCGSSPVATGVIRLSLGYAKSLVVDMGFLLEGDDEEHLPERIFGCVRMKSIDFGPHLRHVISLPVSGHVNDTMTDLLSSTV